MHRKKTNNLIQQFVSISSSKPALLSMTKFQHNLSTVFAALATAISLSICCPIGQCTQLPNINNYFFSALSHETALLQAQVNVSTTLGLLFQPQHFPEDTSNIDHLLPAANGCEGKDTLNFTSRDVGVESPCPWRYKCDYNPQRIPAFIFHASCERATPQGDQWRGVCAEVYYPISYLETRSCDPLQESSTADSEWNLAVGIVPISCNLQQPLI